MYPKANLWEQSHQQVRQDQLAHQHQFPSALHIHRILYTCHSFYPHIKIAEEMKSDNFFYVIQ